jgi:hypothetical protein
MQYYKTSRIKLKTETQEQGKQQFACTMFLKKLGNQLVIYQ